MLPVGEMRANHAKTCFFKVLDRTSRSEMPQYFETIVFGFGSFYFSENVASSEDKLNNVYNKDDISLAHACNNLLVRPREVLFMSSD